MAFDLQETRQFLARILPWPQDGEEAAYTNIHNTFIPSEFTPEEKPGKKKLPWTGRAVLTMDKAISAIKYAIESETSKDIYFCTSTQREAKEKISIKGNRYMGPIRSQSGVVRIKALFIDLDQKFYDDQDALITSLGKFIAATLLPKPSVIVSTGGGFHVYWTMVRALTVEEWQPLANALVEAIRQHELKCDAGCSMDAARVLRVPGTLNYKYEPPRPVKTVAMRDFDYTNEKIEAALEPYRTTTPSGPAKKPVMNGQLLPKLFPPLAPVTGDTLGMGVDSPTLHPVDLDSTIHECGFLAQALADGGRDFGNPLWNLTTLISTFTAGARDDAHRMAFGHAEYRIEETNSLFDRKNEEKAQKNLGWPRCRIIASSGSVACKTCPHLNEDKSPLHFGNRVMPNLLPNTTLPNGVTNNLLPGTGKADADLPPNYLRNPQGIVLYARMLDDGTSAWLPVAHYPMTSPWLQRDPWTLNFTTSNEVGRTTQVKVPLEDVEASELQKTLHKQGFMVRGRAQGLRIISEFLMAWVTQLQNVKDSIVSSVPFGWLVRNGKTHGFVFGGTLHTPHGEEVAANTDPELARQFSPTGEKQPWIDAAKMINDQCRPELDAILASSFAAPMVRFTGHQGLLMSAYSVESGIGKTTAIKVAQSVWGDPVKGVQTLSDTQNSVFNKMGELRSLPVYWDELKSEEDTRRFVDGVFRLSQGVERKRLNSKIAQRTPGTWQTIMVSGSNESLLDMVTTRTRATTAGIFRVFEFTVRPPVLGSPGQIDPTDAQRMISKLHDNYGVIGMEYAAFLGANHDQIDADLSQMMKEISAEAMLQQDERLWLALIGSILMGARYANQLGFTNIDEAGLRAFLLQTLEEMRGERHKQPVDMRNVENVVNTLARFLNERRVRNTIYTNTIHRARGKPPAGTIDIVRDATRLEAVQVHVGINDRVVRIGQSYFNDWLAEHNYPRHVMVKALMEEMNAKQTSGRLGAGTSYANASEYLIEIDLAGTPLANFLDEA